MISGIGDLSEYKILVTGACGFLGHRTVKALIENGAFVLGIDSNLKRKHLNGYLKNRRFSFVLGDFNKKSAEVSAKFKAKSRKKTAVIHLAGMPRASECEKNPSKAFESNVFLTSQVLEFCRRNKIGKFVFPSTALVYGSHLERPATEADRTFPPNVYAATKLASEMLIQGYASSFNLCGIIARTSNIYGKGVSTDTVAGAIFKQLKSGDKVVVDDLRPVRDFIYVDDVIEGLIRTMVMIEDGCHVINLSTGVGSSIQRLAETICKIAFIPVNRVKFRKKKSVRSTLVLNNSLLFKVTGWKPRYSLSEGLSLTLNKV